MIAAGAGGARLGTFTPDTFPDAAAVGIRKRQGRARAAGGEREGGGDQEGRRHRVPLRHRRVVVEPLQ